MKAFRARQTFLHYSYLSLMAVAFVACKTPQSAKISLGSNDVPTNVVIPIVIKGHLKLSGEKVFRDAISFQEGWSEVSIDDPTKPKEEAKPAQDNQTKKETLSKDKGTSIAIKAFAMSSLEEVDPSGITTYHYIGYILPNLLKPSTKYEVKINPIMGQDTQNENAQTEILGHTVRFQTGKEYFQFIDNPSLTNVQVSTDNQQEMDARQLAMLGFNGPVDPSNLKAGIHFCDIEKESKSTSNESLCQGNVPVTVKLYAVIDVMPKGKWITYSYKEYAVRGINVKQDQKYGLAVELKSTDPEDKEKEPIDLPKDFNHIVIKNKSDVSKIEDLKPRPAEVYTQLKARMNGTNPEIDPTTKKPKDENLQNLHPMFFQINA